MKNTREPAELATGEPTWSDYYEASVRRPVRPLLLRGLHLLDPPEDEIRVAVDLGCGDGTESMELLRRGWRVHAVDSEPAAIAALEGRAPDELRDRLRTVVAPFEEVEVPPCDLVHAGFSLPFCHPDHFDRLWSKLKVALQPRGCFVGQLFGVRDDWADQPNMTFHTRDDVEDLLHGFTPLVLEEVDEDGSSFGGPKHWHLFHIVAVRTESPA